MIQGTSGQQRERSGGPGAGYSFIFSSFFFLFSASPRSLSEQASQMVFSDAFAQIMQTFFLG